MYCKLCEDYVGIMTTQSYCETCRKIKNIQRVYGKQEVLEILIDVCLRDEMKRQNKITAAVTTGCYSPSCKPKTRSQAKAEAKNV